MAKARVAREAWQPRLRAFGDFLKGGRFLAVPQEHTEVAGSCRMTSTGWIEFEPRDFFSAARL
jgi:hypothetical protein